MTRAIDITGQRFGKLVAIEVVGRNPFGHLLWRLRCDCGGETTAQTGQLRAGKRKACACGLSKPKHGMHNSRIYRIWSAMKARCQNPKLLAYQTYGELSPRKDNAVFICHALTGDSHVAGRRHPDDRKPGWWDGFVGPGKGIDTILDVAFELREAWGKRVPTGELNRWFEDAVGANPPPAPKGKRIKLRYITQVKSRPPTFVVFGNRTDELPESYRRYLLNALRLDLKLGAVPLRLNFRGRGNPFAR